MKKPFLLFLVVFAGTLFSFDRFYDISLTTDFTKLRERSHVDFNSQAGFPLKGRSILINPRISLYFDGTMDVSLATGMRHEFKYGTLGHHVFLDSSSLKNVHFQQVGHSLDFLTPNFDYRINYYHPLVKSQTTQKYLFSSHKWVEAEIIWKNKFCQVGIGPKYDLFNKEWGSQVRAIVPFKFFSLGTLFSYEKNTGFSGCFSLSFRLFSTPRSSLLHAPICHRSRVQYSKQVIVVPPPVVPKRQETKPDLDKPKENPPEQEIPVPANQDPIVSPNDEAIIPPPPRTPHWWDFFFRHSQDKIE